MMVNFTPSKDIPDLTGRVILITGGTDGLGKESVLQLSQHHPFHIYLAARSKSKAESTISAIKSEYPSSCPITHIDLDLTSFGSIKSAAQTFQSMSSRLDILMCNAGMMGAKGVTKEGYEISWGVNHVGHALLIRLLMPTLQATAKSPLNSSSPSLSSIPRVVVVASDAERFAPKNSYLLEPSEIKSDLSSYSTFARYGHSKLANIHYTAELAKRFSPTSSSSSSSPSNTNEPNSSNEGSTSIRFISIHPGAVTTNLGSDIMPNWPRVQAGLRKVIGVMLGMVTVQEGAKNQLWAAVAPDEQVENGAFYHPVGLAGKGTKKVYDEALARTLWEWTETELEGHI